MDPLSILDRTNRSEGASRRWVCVQTTPETTPASAPLPAPLSSAPVKDKTKDKEKKERISVAILDPELKESGLIFSPMKLSQSEKALLRDNMTSVRRRDIQPKFLRVSHENMKAGTYLSTALRLVHQDHAYKIKRISFDRPVLHNGLLYFVDALDRDTKESFHIWLYVRLVRIQDDVAMIQDMEQILMTNKKTKKEEPRPLLEVHDWNCKKCKHRKPCDHKFKSVHLITDYSVGLHIKFPLKLEGTLYLYCITLNSPRQAALSSRIYLSQASKKTVERSKKEKERRKLKAKEKMEALHSDEFHTDGSDSGSSSMASFSEVVTDTSSSSHDLANDLMDEETFFEKAYDSAAFVKRPPPPPRLPDPPRTPPEPGALSILDALRGTAK